MPFTSPVRVCRTSAGYHPTQAAYFLLPDAGSHQPVHSSPTNHPIRLPSPVTPTSASSPVRSQVHGRCIARPNHPHAIPPRRPTDGESSHFLVGRDSVQTTPANKIGSKRLCLRVVLRASLPARHNGVPLTSPVGAAQS
jgi:hypothetical protein